MLKGIVNKAVWLSILVVPLAQAEALPDRAYCGAEEAMEQLFENHPQVLKEYLDFESSLLSRTQNSDYLRGENEQDMVAEPKYIIPVVFHVYGTSFYGKPVNDSIIIDALQRTNEDFQGLSDDYESVESPFSEIKDILNVEFRLARIDPDGNPTTGITYHSYQSGFADRHTHDEAIQADAWDNYRYMNVYIQDDLSDEPERSNVVGTTYGPASYYSDNNLDRVVYQGAALGSNTNENYRSILTHEFGHWLSLIHPFYEGCVPDNEPLCASTGDNICDTPQVDDEDLIGLNCLGQVHNWQNFMAYSDQYANFTQLQVDRMISAMDHQARKTLWTQTNLIATGTANPGSFKINAGLNDAWYDPATDGQGFFITVFPDLGAVSLAWFTYDTELPPVDAVANLGDAGHRWLTALGPIDGNQVNMNITLTSGGIFDAPSDIKRTNPPGSDGTIILNFDSCNSGTVEYDIPSIHQQGIVPIQRVANDNIVICEALSLD